MVFQEPGRDLYPQRGRLRADSRGGENDLAQNPFDLRAEHGPSLFDATHRFVFSGTWALPTLRNASKAAALLVNGWQLNTIASLSTGTPFTVYDSANVSLQGSAPEISGFYSSRPDLVSDPNTGQPHTPNQWVSRASFRQLNPTTQAGQFGNEGRNAVRGPGIEDVDLSLFKYFPHRRHTAHSIPRGMLQPAESSEFRIARKRRGIAGVRTDFTGRPPRLLQLALKFQF
ncbi:MAG: hypothetical protein WDO73_02175 [Ignavibacteriota bacterium]